MNHSKNQTVPGGYLLNGYSMPCVISSTNTGGRVHNVGCFFLMLRSANLQEILCVEFFNSIPLHLCCVLELRV
jgi:hypothetical protein